MPAVGRKVTELIQRQPGRVGLILAAVAVIPAAWIAWTLVLHATAQADHQLHMEAHNLLAAVQLGGLPQVQRDLALADRHHDPRARTIIIAAGRMFGTVGTQSDRTILLDLSPGQPEIVALSTGPVRALHDTAERQQDLQGKGYEDLAVILATPYPSAVEASALTLTVWTLLATGLAVALAITVRRLYRSNYDLRLIEINSGLTAIRHDRFVPIRLDGAGPPEIVELAQNCNLMIDSLRERVHGLRIFVDVAAHELRTPLTRMGLLIDRMLRAGTAPVAADLRDLAGDTHELLHLLEGLLGLAQTQATLTDRSRFEEIDVSDLCLELHEDHEPEFQAASLSLEVQIDPGLAVYGERSLVRRLMENLVDNARKYSREQTTTRISLTRSADRFQFVIENAGGFPADIRDRAFEPHSRSVEAAAKPGFGLGLHVARAIIVKHGWSIELGGTRDIARVMITGNLIRPDEAPPPHRETSPVEH